MGYLVRSACAGEDAELIRNKVSLPGVESAGNALQENKVEQPFLLAAD
jgi:hypothetical protein